jgi:hypothetical protein
MRKAAVMVTTGAAVMLLVGILALLVLSLTAAVADGWRLRSDAARTERDPSFSPDGGQIAFIRVASGTPSLWVMDADGSDQQRLARAERFSWAGSGALLLARSGHVYRVAAVGGDAVPAHGPLGQPLRRLHGKTLLVRDRHVAVRDSDGAVWKLT